MELKKNYFDFNSYYKDIGFESNQINNKNNNLVDNNMYLSNDNINANKDNKETLKMKNSITNNINENELFNITKDNFSKTSTFFNNDYLKSYSMDKKVPNSNRNNNRQNNTNYTNSFSSINLYPNSDKNINDEIEIKYHYYLSNLNKEKNNENNANYNISFVQENEQIQKLLEEEKNIEDENLKRLNELRVKYLSSIKTFDITQEVKNDNQIYNHMRELKPRAERNNLIENYNINANNKNMNKNNNSSLSLKNNNNIFKPTNSFNDIIKTPNDLSDINKSSPLMHHEQSVLQNIYKENIFNVLTPKQNEIDSTNRSNIGSNYNSKSQNQSMRKLDNIFSKSLKDEFEKIEIKGEKKTDNQNQNDLNKNEKILNDAKINMAIYESNPKDKNNSSQLFNSRQNSNQEFYFKYDDSIDEKKKIMEKNKSVDYIRSSQFYNEFGNNEINNNNHKVEKMKNIERFKEDKNQNENIKNKNELINQNINAGENNFFNKSINNDNNTNAKNINLDKNDNYNNDFMNNYQQLKDNYNQLKLEYDSLKNDHLKLLEEYKKDKIRFTKNEIDEKTLFNDYIVKENNDLRAINSNYEYIITPLINYINDINYHINKKNLKKLNIIKIKQNIRNTNSYNHIEENPLYSLVLLLDNYKNIIVKNESNKSLSNRSKSNIKKISTYESLMKTYNIKDNIIFKSNINKTGDKNKNVKSIVVPVTPIYSKKMKSKLFGKEDKINKTDKNSNLNKTKSKATDKRKQIKDKILKKDNSSGKRKKFNYN